MGRYPDFTRLRIAQLRDAFRERIYSCTAPVDSLDVSNRVGRIPLEEAMKLTYRPASLGEQFGPLFATYWFRIRLTIPQAWQGQRVDLLWDSHSECTLWIAGRSVEGLNGANNYGRIDATLVEKAAGGEQIELYLEMACNDSFGFYGEQWPEHRSPIFLDRCQIGLFDPLAWEIYHDLHVLCELEKEQVQPGWAGVNGTPGGAGDLDKAWGGKLLYELNRFANTCDIHNRDTWSIAHPILKDLLACRNGDYTHELSAIGHAHIDTAWLWPLAETHRKCVRTFSTQLRYLEAYPAYRFVCSQAYQYDVIKRDHPELYQRIRDAVKRGQWIPVGGTWIEPDCNIPSGESLCRQFLYGQRFFEREFGRRCREFWNPDAFGFNGQLPQIMQQAGITRFLTQKLAWNKFNPPLYHTFCWQGLDGSRVLAHSPPANTYNGDCSVSQVRRHVRQYKDNDRSREALYLFGYGDGGCGPTKSMIEQMLRYRDLQGMPRCQMRSVDEFFDRLERDARDLPTLVGELYLELHRGTYTTQARTKRGNRKGEVLLHDAEFLAAVAAIRDGEPYPHRQIEELWKLLLLNQFHDILPGSGINEVYRDAEAHYQRIEHETQRLRDHYARQLIRDGDDWLIINTIGVDRREVVEQPDGQLTFVHAPPYGVGEPVIPVDSVAIHERDDRIVLENATLRAELHKDGRLLSLIHKPTSRETIEPGRAGNMLELSDDQPTMWEAWDVDPFIVETQRPCPPAQSYRITCAGPLRAEVTFSRLIGCHSSMTQAVRLDAGSHRLEFHCQTDWQENQKMLKVAFPLNVWSMRATYETQFGVVERPTHANHTIALAQFEVPGHRWADLSEHGFGAALLSESKYGYSCRGNTLRMSLLRSTTMPDPTADRGPQQFSYALYPHRESWQAGGVVAEGLRFNYPLLISKGQASDVPVGASLFHLDDSNLICDTVKLAEDGDAVVLRLYECHGARGIANLKLGLPFRSAAYCNILEDETSPPWTIHHQRIEVPYTPYRLISLKLYPR